MKYRRWKSQIARVGRTLRCLCSLRSILNFPKSGQAPETGLFGLTH